MRRSLPWLGLLALIMILLPALAADDDTDAKAKPDATDKKQVDKLVKSGKSFIGKLVKVDADQHYLAVQVTYTTTKQDPQIVQNLAKLQVQMVDAQRNRNPVERLRQINHIQADIDRNN